MSTMRQVKSGWFVGMLMVCALVTAVGVQAQAGGTIQGLITDAEGVGISGVTVLITNTDTGTERTAVTGSEGFYSAPALKSGIYSLTASLEGLQPVQRDGVQLLIGQVVDVDLQMEVGTVEAAMVVTGESPLIETSRSSAAAYVSEDEIEALPIAGRDFTEFAFLTPTVQKDTDRGFLTMSGQRGIYSGMNIDGTAAKSAFFGYGRGGEATENDGLVVAQDSVKEFQVVTSGFNPEYGASGGGYVNVVTKSGTNDFKGTAFFLFRDDSMVEDLPSSPRDDFRGIDGSREVAEFERSNWGASLGGPITRDKTHFFVSYDQTQRDDPFTADLEVPGLLDAVLSRGPDFAPLVEGYERNPDGTATGLFLSSTDNLVLFGKLDHQFNPSHTGTFRINFTDFERTNNLPSAESLKAEDTISTVASLVSVFGTDKVNEFRIQFAEDNLDRLSDLEGAPVSAELEIQEGGAFASIGKAFFLPIFVTEEKLQIQDNFSYLFGDHELQFGIDYQKDDLSQLFAGFKDGRYRFTSLENFLNNDALFSLIFYGPTTNPNFDVTQELASVYAQDTWRPNDRLTVNYGFRFGRTDNPSGIEHVFPEGREIPDDTNNFAPRVGFAYSLDEDGWDVLRGGAGIFYGRTPTLLFAGPVVQNGLFPNLGIVFTLFFQEGFQPFGQPIDNLAPPPGTANEPNLVDPDWEDAETTRLNLGYERKLASNWTAGIDAIYAETEKLQSNIDSNLPAPTFDEFGRPMYTLDRPNPDFGEIFTRTSVGESEYKAVTLSIRRRYSGRYQLQAHYTWSKDEDTDSNERSATGVTVSDTTNPDYDFGLSDRDVQNRFVVSGHVELPYGFKLSGILEYRSGRPWTPTDAFLEDSYCPHGNCPSIRAVIDGQLGGRNSRRNESIQKVDFRLSKLFRFGNDRSVELFAEAFNLFDENSFAVGFGERQPTEFDGVTPNPEFGIPDTLVTTPRQFQLGARVRF